MNNEIWQEELYDENNNNQVKIKIIIFVFE